MKELVYLLPNELSRQFEKYFVDDNMNLLVNTCDTTSNSNQIDNQSRSKKREVSPFQMKLRSHARTNDTQTCDATSNFNQIATQSRSKEKTQTLPQISKKKHSKLQLKKNLEFRMELRSRKINSKF